MSHYFIHERVVLTKEMCNDPPGRKKINHIKYVPYVLFRVLIKFLTNDDQMITLLPGKITLWYV
jgi:hypothetical protein